MKNDDARHTARPARSGGGPGTWTPERWERVHEALHATLDLPPLARPAFLEQLGRDDAALRREVESLVEALSASGRFDALVDRFVPAEPDAAVPRRIGPWRPIRVLGRGGMGTVWLAERADGAYDQRVALKLLPVGIRADVQSRFLAERRILARLKHPNIARLLDGGTTADGQPYLVLEYVQGEPVTAYCDRMRLPVDARLRLFLDICAAVERAHANLIVHRDIKPANVLVEATDEGPRVKLLDFGIAKLMDADPSVSDSPVTRAGLRLLTPDYAAPEQIRGEAITTAVDVYQLGALLYELSCGRRVHRIRSGSLAEMQREICQKDAVPLRIAFGRSGDGEPPSEQVAHARATTVARLARSLEGDLDTITMHALVREPERRYPSVEAFAADVRNHLSNRPVQARPDSLMYRAAKFVRRNTAAVVAGSAIAILLFALALSTVLQNRRYAVEKERAEQVARHLTEIFEELGPATTPGSTVHPREVLDRGAQRIAAEMDGDPLLQARMYAVLGRIFHLRGGYAEAEALLRRALAIRMSSLGPDHDDVAETQASLAALLTEVERPGEALPLLSAAAVTLRTNLGGEDPRVASLDVDRARVLRDMGDLDSAETLLAGAVVVLRREPDSQSDLASALREYGRVRLGRGDAVAAEPLIGEALSIRRELFGPEHPSVADALDGVGELYRQSGSLGEAESAFRDALRIRRRTAALGGGPAVGLEDIPPALLRAARSDVGVSYLNLGTTLYFDGRTRDAAAFLDSALALLTPTFGPDHSLVRTAVAYRDSAGANRRRR